jgi:hypothetical protein
VLFLTACQEIKSPTVVISPGPATYVCISILPRVSIYITPVVWYTGESCLVQAGVLGVHQGVLLSPGGGPWFGPPCHQGV